MRRAGRRRTPACGERGCTAADVRLPSLLSAVHRRDRPANPRYRAVPDRFLESPGFGLGPPGVGGAADPGRCRAFFFAQPALGQHRRLLPGPGLAQPPVRAGPSWNAIGGADPRVGLLADDVEALLVRVPESEDAELASPQTYLVPIDACYEFVGGLRMLWRGFDGGQEARGVHRRVLRRIAERAWRNADDRAARGHRLRVLDVAPEPFTVSPVLTARVSVAAGGDDPVHAIALRCQVRIEPLRRAYTDEKPPG